MDESEKDPSVWLTFDERSVRNDLNEILGKYDSISEQLADDFFAEFRIGIERDSYPPLRSEILERAAQIAGGVFGGGVLLWDEGEVVGGFDVNGGVCGEEGAGGFVDGFEVGEGGVFGGGFEFLEFPGGGEDAGFVGADGFVVVVNGGVEGFPEG